MDIVRVIRIIVYEGERDWVERQIERSITGTKVPNPKHPHNKISVSTLGEFPEIMGELKPEEVMNDEKVD